MIRWNEDPPIVHEVPRLDDDQIDDLFYQEDEIGEMRHTAFMIECGLEEDPPDGPDVDPVPWTQEQLLAQQKKKNAASSKSGTAVAKSSSSSSKTPASPPRSPRQGLERTASLDRISSKSPKQRRRLVATKSGTLPKRRTDDSAVAGPLGSAAANSHTSTTTTTTSNKSGKKLVGRSSSADDIELVETSSHLASGASSTSSTDPSSVSPKSPRRSRLVATKSGTLHGMRAAAKKAKGKDQQSNKASGDGGQVDGDIIPPRTRLVATKSGTLHGMRRAKKSDIVPVRSDSGKATSMTLHAQQLQTETDAPAADKSSSKSRARPSSAIRASRTTSCSGSGVKARRKEKNDSSASSLDTTGIELSGAEAETDASNGASNRSTPRRGSGLVQTRSGSQLKKLRRKEKDVAAAELINGSASGNDGPSPSLSSQRPTPVRGSGLIQTRSGADLKKTRRRDKEASATTNGETAVASSSSSRSTPDHGSGPGHTHSSSDSRRAKRSQDRTSTSLKNHDSFQNNTKSSSTLSYSSGEEDLPSASLAKKVVYRNGKRVLATTPSSASSNSSSTCNNRSSYTPPDEPKRIVFKNGKRVVVGRRASSASAKPTSKTISRLSKTFNANNDDDDDGDRSSVGSSASQSDDVSISTSEEEDDGPVTVSLAKRKGIRTPPISKLRSSSAASDAKTPSSASSKKGSSAPKYRSQSSIAGSGASLSPTRSKPLSVNERMKAFQSNSSSLTSLNSDSSVPAAFRASKKISYRKPKSSKSDIVPPAFR